MNRFIIGFVFLILTARFFTETIKIMPKGADLIDLAVIPLLLLMGFMYRLPRDIDHQLHHKIVTLTGAFVILCFFSTLVNMNRVSVGPLFLFLFGMLEGPILFFSLNKVIKDKRKFGRQVVRFINVIVIFEILVVVFINYPFVIATGNPDAMSGTFGLNSYQFSALLIIIGGYFMGRQFAKPKSIIIALAMQFFVLITFLLLQYRTAIPAFFLAFLALTTVLYGKRILRLAGVVAAVGMMAFFGFQYIGKSSLDLGYEDMVVLAGDFSVVGEYGKVLSYINTVDMYGEEPLTILFGSGPGTFVSRANYTFVIDYADKRKGVGPILTAIFGDEDYRTDVYRRYIQPLFHMQTMFGSMQANNPNSSILAVAAELGIPGLVVLAWMYTVLVVYSLKYLRYAMARRDPVILPLASALFIGAVYLCMISPLDNYMEMARLTIPVWFLFWAVSSAVRQQETDQQAALAMAAQYEEYYAEPVEENDPSIAHYKS